MKDEHPRLERVLKALEGCSLVYRRHEKCRSARELVGVFADESQMFGPILDKGELDMSSFQPGSYAALPDALAAFGRGFGAALRIEGSISDGDWARR